VKLSVCVVSYNTRDILRECLRSVVDETGDIALEVIVVDNASGDGSVGMVAREFPQVRLIANAENRRFAIGNNQALREASGEYLLLLNSDTIVLDRALVKMTEFMDAHPDVGALGCRLVTREGAPTRSFGAFPTVLRTVVVSWPLTRGLFRASRWRFVGVLPEDWIEAIEVDWPSGACLMTRRRAVEQVGLLDESFWLYGEEVDFCWRLKMSGWRRMLLPVSVIHMGGGSTNTAPWVEATRCVLADWQVVRKGRSRLYWRLFVFCELLGVTWQFFKCSAKRLLGKCSRAELSDVRLQTKAMFEAALKGNPRTVVQSRHVGTET
jgi:hypothetical protein